ncbi:MAG: cytochrome P460 family protein [Novosphingobium sp.]|nr:cytochrome P460 family protein [Novosphingobium sp.]
MAALHQRCAAPRALLACTLALGLGLSACTKSAPPAAADSGTNAAGVLHVPAHYRETYQALGSWAIAAEGQPGSQQIHLVYASPGAAEAHRKTGHFPDGTTLVKEVFAATTAPMTTGTVSHADTLKGWFVMVKDSKNSHAGNTLWGDGWGWAWFDADKPAATSTSDYKAECQACHLPAKANDWTYVEGYPVLKN